MGSRIREDPQKIFDLFFEAACLVPEDYDARVLRQFPLEFDDQESIQTLPKFCFPFDIEKVKDSPAVQHFTFALTDLEGKQRFGFCRLAKDFRACLCILSYLPWFEVFYKILNIIADHLAKEQFTELNEFLSMLYLHPVPKFNSPISLEFASYFIAPDQGKLPTIPESRNLTEFVVAVDVNNMLGLYASLLHERRILLTSSKLSTLTACVHASSAMLYPMHWQHIYIPALPSHLLDYCCAPMPYLIGVHSSLMERVRTKALEDVVILNIDSNTLESPFQDLENLPSDVVSLLKSQLKKQSATTGDGVARAVLRAQALLFGSYREALVPGPFIDDRLEKLNAGEDFADLFEQEIARSLSPGNNMHSYQLWVKNLKKGGGALISTVKNKANPAVRNVYHYAKGQAKMGLRNMRSHLMEKSRPQRPQRQNSTSELQDPSTALPNFPLESDTFAVGAEDLTSEILDLGGLDLLGEIFETLSLSEPSQGGGPLYGTRSLDFSNLEERNFYTKLRPSEETLPATLSEEQDDGSSSLEDTATPASQEEENTQGVFEDTVPSASLEEENTQHDFEDTVPSAPLEEENTQGAFKDTVTSASLEEENTQGALQLSATSRGNGTWGHSTHEDVHGPEQEESLLEVEAQWAMAASVPSQDAQTHKVIAEASAPAEPEMEFCRGVEEGQRLRIDQPLASGAATPLPKAETPAPRVSSLQPAAASFQEKSNVNVTFRAKESPSTVGQVIRPHHPLISRTLTQPRVSELKKRFEA